ncbi:hypothetical protein [Xanthobacter autotrophicus]|uniref:hypothetical protein n=1 Tax=Xanthobacter autotrophicus TaxID=280 RepID=UPI003726C141
MTSSSDSDAFNAYTNNLNGEYFDEFIASAAFHYLEGSGISGKMAIDIILGPASNVEFPFRASELKGDYNATEINLLHVVEVALDTICEMLKGGSIVAVGRRGSVFSEPEKIRMDLWNYIRFKIENNSKIFVPDENVYFYSVRVYWHDLAQADTPHTPAANLPERNLGGRPPKYRWDEIVDRFMVDLGAAPDTVAELVKRVQSAARSAQQGEPDHKTIVDAFEKRFPRFLAAVRDKPK